MDADIIIVGAGLAGLYAASLLSEKQKKVVVIEARDRIGGRIHSIRRHEFPFHLETGAEFIHGAAPLTYKLLKKARLHADNAAGEMIRFQQGKFREDPLYQENAEVISEALKQVQTEMPVTAFLDKYFAGPESNELRKSVFQYIEGYNAGQPERFSTLAFKSEWLDEDGDKQFRVREGYSELANFLYSTCIENGCRFIFSSPVRMIHYKAGKVEIESEQNFLSAPQAVVTIPLNLFADKAGTGRFSINPNQPRFAESVSKLGFGQVIKILLGFKTGFWNDKNKGGGSSLLKKTAFIFSDQEIPTWWTQFPDDKPILTGWLAGPKAATMSNFPDQQLLNLSLQSISKIFDQDLDEIRHQLLYHYIGNWQSETYSGAAYSYSTITRMEALEFINRGLDNSLYFAGEALCDDGEPGTVEAALISAEKLVSRLC